MLIYPATHSSCSVTDSMTETSVRTHTKADYVWTTIRIALGWVFLWAFLDKLLGLGFATTRANAWINGGSPTFGFLSFGTAGPFAGIFQAMAGNTVVDWLFMLGMLGIGVSLILGVAVRIGAYAGIAMMALMFLATLLPENNPIIDDHIVYAVALYGVAVTRHTQALSLERAWANLPVVRNHPALQ